MTISCVDEYRHCFEPLEPKPQTHWQQLVVMKRLEDKQASIKDSTIGRIAIALIGIQQVEATKFAPEKMQVNPAILADATVLIRLSQLSASDCIIAIIYTYFDQPIIRPKAVAPTWVPWPDIALSPLYAIAVVSPIATRKSLRLMLRYSLPQKLGGFERP